MEVSTTDLAVFWAVVFLRFLLPLLVPTFPMPAILACFLLDAVDRTLFTSFTRLDMTGYQGFDKALDIFYLSIAMLTILRNWSSYPAVQIARALFYFRLVGVLVFEMTQWRPTLLLFPNTFEYFFILYELVRSRWSPTRMHTRFFIAAAALIWIVVKLPQEYWIHIAQLDATDMLKDKLLGAGADVGWGPAISRRPLVFIFMLTSIAALIAALIAVGAMLLRRLLGPPRHPLELVADPIPTAIDEAHERDRHIAERWRLFDLHLLEKIVLVGFVTMIFARVLPGVNATSIQLAGATAIIVGINAFLRLRVALAGRSRESAILAFTALALVNAVLVALADLLLRRGAGSLAIAPTLFFLLLLTLIVTLYDRWRPVFDVRFKPVTATADGADSPPHRR